MTSPCHCSYWPFHPAIPSSTPRNHRTQICEPIYSTPKTSHPNSQMPTPKRFPDPRSPKPRRNPKSHSNNPIWDLKPHLRTQTGHPIVTWTLIPNDVSSQPRRQTACSSKTQSDHHPSSSAKPTPPLGKWGFCMDERVIGNVTKKGVRGYVTSVCPVAVQAPSGSLLTCCSNLDLGKQ